MPNLPVPVPYTWTVGDISSSALLNAQVRDTASFLLNPPIFEAIQATTTTSMATSSWTPVAWVDAAGILADTYGGYGSGAPSRYVAQVAGWYQVSGTITWAANSSGARWAQIYRNSVPVAGHGSIINNLGSLNCSVATPTRMVLMAAGDYLELVGWQSSGGSLSTVVTDLRSAVSIRWVHA